MTICNGFKQYLVKVLLKGMLFIIVPITITVVVIILVSPARS